MLKKFLRNLIGQQRNLRRAVPNRAAVVVGGGEVGGAEVEEGNRL
jgi:hypothetical protein